MRLFRTFMMFVLVSASAFTSWASEGRLSKPADIATLKNDIVAGKIVVGETRLYQVKNWYGEPTSISDSQKTVVFLV